jgi:hypothetical protein
VVILMIVLSDGGAVSVMPHSDGVADRLYPIPIPSNANGGFELRR